MNILITGGAGFIGSHIAEHYARKDYEITLFDNMTRTQYQPKSGKAYDHNWQHLNKYPGITRLPSDIRDYEALETAAEDIDVIFHAAAQTQIAASFADPVEDLSSNILGSFNILEVARRSSKKPPVIYLSTSKVYGINVNRLHSIEKEGISVFTGEYANGIPETFSVDGHGHTPFGVSKLAADLYMQEFSHLYGLKIGVFRLSAVYGPRQFGIEEQSWPAKMILDVLLGRPLNIDGGGNITRDLLFVGDLMTAFDAFIDSDIQQGVYNLGGGKENLATPLKLMDSIAAKTGKILKLHHNDAKPYEQRVFYSDNSKAGKKLHWKPETGIAKGLEEIYKWVADNKKLFD